MEGLQERIIGAFTFRTQVYEDVEADTSFTQTAWIIVAVTSFLNQLGSRANVIGASSARSSPSPGSTPLPGWLAG